MARKMLGATGDDRLRAFLETAGEADLAGDEHSADLLRLMGTNAADRRSVGCVRDRLQGAPAPEHLRERWNVLATNANLELVQHRRVRGRLPRSRGCRRRSSLSSDDRQLARAVGGRVRWRGRRQAG
jgi:hypothetical protein